jgi:NAD(P) transhydrogenase
VGGGKATGEEVHVIRLVRQRRDVDGHGLAPEQEAKPAVKLPLPTPHASHAALVLRSASMWTISLSRATARSFCTSALRYAAPDYTPYSALTVGSPRETYPQEKRVALTPANVQQLLKHGFKQVLIAENAGAGAQFTDAAYRAAGATVVRQEEVFAQSNIVLKVRPPEALSGEAKLYSDKSTLISFLYPSQNKALVEELAQRKVTAFAMDCIPRISRAFVLPLAFLRALKIATDKFLML